MTNLTAAQIYQLARGAGLGNHAAVTATAIAFAESNGRTDAKGDVTLEDGTWGPSVGLWQIRSLKSEYGTGKSRDASRLTSPAFNAHSMAVISNGGADFGPWSTFKSGAYKPWISTVQTAIKGGTTVPPGPTAGASPVGFHIPGPDLPHLPDVPNPFDLGGAATDLGGDVLSGVGNKAGDVAAGVVELLVKSMAPAVLIGAGLVGGFALIAIGVWRGTESD